LYARNNNFSAFSPGKLLRRSEYVCPAALNSCSLAALVCGADKNFLAGGAIDSSRLQQQRQTESAHCSVLTASQYSCFAGGGVDSGFMRLQVTLSYARRALAQPKYWLSFFVFTAIKKKKRKRKCGCLFRPKNKTPKNKTPKNKKMRFFGAEK